MTQSAHRRIALRYRLVKAAVWLRRIRHRCGYGIHSPFAFNLVTRVVYERGTFGGYEALRPLAAHTVLREKDLRLLFRLANDLQPRRGLAFTSDTAATESLCQGCRRLHLQLVPPADAGGAADATRALAPDAADAPPLDFIYADRPEDGPAIASLLPQAAPTLFVVVAGIHRHRTARASWEALRRRPEVRVSFDLYDFGFLCTNPHYARQHYVVNYL